MKKHALAATLIVGCGTQDLVWYYDFVDDTLAPAALVAEIREGGCEGSVVHSQTFAPGSAMTPPSLGGGDFGFVIRAHDASCNVIAEGCTMLSLPHEGSVTVEVENVVPPRPGCADDQTCNAGRCEGGEMDAGPAPECAPGCFNGTECAEGNTNEACGSGGGFCEECCGDETCEAGHCVVSTPVSAVSAGDNFICALTEAGRLYCWGDNGIGQTGIRCCGDSSGPVEPMGAPTDWTEIHNFGLHTCALRGTAAACWGSNNNRQLGRDTAPNENSSDLLPPIGSTAWAEISVGVWHSLGIDSTGRLYCWGDAEHEACAMSGITQLPEPTRVGTEDGWTSVCGGFFQSCGIRNRGLFCWGWNMDGETGRGSVGGATTNPTPVVATMGVSDWEEVTCGFGHTCARRANGEVYCFGCDGEDCYSGAETVCGGSCAGKLGRGAQPSSGIATRVPDILARTIDAGGHTCAVTTDGSLYCWGPNPHGQLGVGDTAPRNTPTLVAGPDWVDVSVGLNHTCAIREGGALYCWGRNDPENGYFVGGGGASDVLRPDRICF